MRTASTVMGGLALAVALVSPNIAHAANMITNGEFELHTATVNQYGFATLAPGATELTGWSITQGTIDIVPANYWAPASGGNSIDLTGTPGQGGISQTVATEIGKTYLLTFDLAANPESNSFLEHLLSKRMDVLVESDAGDVLAYEEFGLHVGLATKFSMGWKPEAVVFTATDLLTTITFTSTGIGEYCGPVLDNVYLDLAPGGNPPDDEGGPRTPEPASLAVLGLGGLALLQRRRK